MNIEYKKIDKLGFNIADKTPVYIEDENTVYLRSGNMVMIHKDIKPEFLNILKKTNCIFLNTIESLKKGGE